MLSWFDRNNNLLTKAERHGYRRLVDLAKQLPSDDNQVMLEITKASNDLTTAITTAPPPPLDPGVCGNLT